jgi:ATP-dependent Lon protease
MREAYRRLSEGIPGRQRLKKNETDKKYRITAKTIHRHLGIPRFRFGLAEEKDEVGLSTGLAWTEVGGELLQIETTLMPGKGKLTITGKLGDVMQESAQAGVGPGCPELCSFQSSASGIVAGFLPET